MCDIAEIETVPAVEPVRILARRDVVEKLDGAAGKAPDARLTVITIYKYICFGL